jgi:glycosyltransferase involved in cell wall biosynthesis
MNSTRRPRALYVQYTNPAAYPPLEHSAQILADAGFDVRLVGIATLGDRLDFKPHPHIAVTLRPAVGPGASQKIHYLAFVISLIAITIRWRPDWIYLSDPLACPIGECLRLVTSARLIYHEHDSPDDRRPESPFMRMVMGARHRIARRASLCVLPNAERSARFARATGCRDVAVVWNCPMREDVSDGPIASTSPALRVLYHGSIGPTRLPATVVRALAELPASVSLTIAGYETSGHVGHLDALAKLAAELGVANRVTYVGTVRTRQELMRQCSHCDVGLSLMPLETSDVNERAMVGASNKAFDYMAGGLAVLVSARQDWQDVFVAGGFGLDCDPRSAESIAAALSAWLVQPNQRVEMGERGRRQIATAWNYETVFAPVLAHMTQPVVPHGAPSRLPLA